MNIINYIQRQQVNPIEVGAFDKAATTLQQGHKEAVKAASDLELAIAKLDLNEKEDAFRAAKLNQIKDTIRANTIYGNSYGALSKIIESQGSILGGADMIGRLKAQAEYKQYQDTLDKRQDISQDVKDRFKEMNPYYYADKIDKKTGEIIGGTKWSPNSTPVEGVDMSKVASMALQLAASEKGGSNKTTWLDADGNPTTDYRKSVTGAVFNVTTQTWEQLSEEKIQQGIRAALGLVKGAKASAKQDYETAVWKYNKNKKADKNYVGDSDIIDEDGHIRSFDQYMDHMFMPMIKAASYRNVTISSEYKDGYEKQLAYYKAAAQAQQAAAAAAAGYGANGDLGSKVDPNAGDQGTIDVESNPYPEIVTREASTNQYLLSTIKKAAAGKIGWLKDVDSYFDIMNHYGGAGPGTSMNKLMQELHKAGVSINKDTYNTLQNNASAYYTYNQQKRLMNAGLNEDDKKKLSSGISLNTNHFKKGHNSSEDDVVDLINKLKTNSDKAVITIRPEAATALNNIRPNYFQDSGFQAVRQTDGSYTVTVNKNQYESFARVMGDIERADSSAHTGFFRTIGGFFRREGGGYNVEYYKNGETVFNVGEGFGTLGKKYNNLVDNYTDVARNRLGKVSKTGVMSVQHFAAPTFTQVQLEDAYNRGQINEKEYRQKVTNATNAVNAHLSGGALNYGMIYNADDNNHFSKSQNPEDAGALINYAMNNLRKNVTVNAGEIPIGTMIKGRSVPTAGYFISISIPEGKHVGKYEGGKTYKFFYGGGYVEGTNGYNPGTNAASLGRNTINIVNNQKVPVMNLLTTPGKIAEASVTPTSAGGFYCKFGTKGREVDQVTSEDFATACYQLDQLYDQGINALYRAQQLNPQNFNNTMGSITQRISVATGMPPATVATMVANYLNTPR
jgi:hypothetical protein|nr:MAG TPA: hypothetical protein [Crassvirales sp.]